MNTCLLRTLGAAIAFLPALSATAQDVATSHQHASQPTPPASVEVPLDHASRAALPRKDVVASAHGRSLSCQGVSLTALMQAADIMPTAPLRGPQLTRYVLVTATDGYRALFSLAEFDPTLGGAEVYVVDHCDGAALDADSGGPLRLLVPGDARPARGVRNLESISVQTVAPSPVAQP